MAGLTNGVSKLSSDCDTHNEYQYLNLVKQIIDRGNIIVF